MLQVIRKCPATTRLRVAWSVALGAVVVGGCAEPCLDDGFLRTQHDPSCKAVAATETGTAATTAVETTTTTTTTTEPAGTTTTTTTGSTDTTSTATTDGSSTTAGGADCLDGVQNGDESDVDCGGALCSPCPNGQHCAGQAANCASAACNGDLCVDLAPCTVTMSDVLADGINFEGLELLSAVGDVNGDAAPDLVVGAPAGGFKRAYVLLGALDPPVDLALVQSGEGGYLVDALEALDALAPAGDFNADGFADLAIGEAVGYVDVVFGQPGQPPLPNIDAANLGDQGFTIIGDSIGAALAGGLDVDGDGAGDLVIGAPDALGGMAPAAFVVFGDPSLTNFSSVEIGGSVGGFQILGGVLERTGAALALMPSINGDARAEVVVGAPSFGFSQGRVFVVHGQASGMPVDLDSLGAGGFAITTALSESGLGGAVASGGDVDGDGLADILVGANTSRAYVIFGKADTADVDVDTLGTAGFAVQFEGGSCTRVTGGPDLNGDGLAEVLVHDPFVSPETVWVVYGKADSATVLSTDLELGLGGFTIGTADPGTQFGASVAFGDLLGIGAYSLAISAPMFNQGPGRVVLVTPGLCD